MKISTNKGMRGVSARYISIVRHPGRPVISGMERCTFLQQQLGELLAIGALQSLPMSCSHLAEESKPSPAQKVKKESPGESLGESPRVLADPPKRVKNESPGDSASQKSPVF